MATKTPTEVVDVANCFIQYIRRNNRREDDLMAMLLRSSPFGGGEDVSPKQTSMCRFPNNLIINLDETPLPFEFLNGYSYDFKGATTVAGKSERSGWYKRQATIILYIMADDSTPFKPVIIFHGKGTVARREHYDERVDVYFNETAYNNKDLFHTWLQNTFQPYIMQQVCGIEESLIVMDAAAFHKNEAIRTFIKQAQPSIRTAIIPPGLTSLVQPLDTAVNGPFKQLLHEEADFYLEELEKGGGVPDPWTLKDRRQMPTAIVARAWDRLRKDVDLIKRAFLHCGISIHPGGTEDHLINIKGVDNSSLDPNGWRGRSLHPSHQVVSEDFDYMTALISAAEELKPQIKQSPKNICKKNVCAGGLQNRDLKQSYCVGCKPTKLRRNLLL
jgi:hypothetical protein